MPPKPNFTAFVHEKNPPDGTRMNAPQGQHDFHDLYADPPPHPKSAAARQQSQESGQRYPPHKRQTRSAAQSRDPSQKRGAIYETDASDADRTSTAHSERHVFEEQQQQQRPIAQKHEEIPEHDFTEGPGDESDQSTDQLAGPSRRISTKETDGDPEVARQRARGFMQKSHMKGDSYPSTTSGAPSQMVTTKQPQPAVDRIPSHSNLAGLPPGDEQRQRLGGPSRAVLPQQASAQVQSQQHHQAREAPSARAPRTVPLTMQGGPIQNPAAAPMDVFEDVASTFTYAKRSQVHNDPSRPEKRPNGQTVQSPSATQQFQSAKTGGHQVLPTYAHGRSNGRVSAHPKALVDQQRPASPQVSPVQHDPNHLRHAYKPQNDIPQQEARAPSEAEYPGRDVNGFKVDQEDEVMGEELQFDYDHETLVSMKYEDVKAADFDVDPHAQPFHLPGDMSADTLHGKLASMRRFEPQAQAAFFASLPLSEWEEAGDWFMEQFGQTLAKYKHARQEKRKAAKQFEDEIARRHEAVSKKRKVTEDALMDMRQSGSQVLFGTPKGKKQR
ncbi:Extracellular mutant protein 11 [Teratosphaeria destructans]|uniref:Extracellular mutant protein 11 n=1 Tax=Teratosphaeria destructans TaxID=418781 RepID=A0A9W7W1A7_9PEZI|nr:Extracellular mutant protein 11 [Teratosphaeria destructans]